MATKLYTPLDSPRPASPIDSLNGHADSSWYRHSGHFSAGRPVSPAHSDKPSLADDNVFSDGKPSSLHATRPGPDFQSTLAVEITTLRQQLDRKNSFIHDLELQLQSGRADVDSINARLHHTLRDTASRKKQAEDSERHLQDLTDQLAAERDAALAASNEWRSRLNTLTSKARRQEEDIERWQADRHDEDKVWADDKRILEQRLHTTEAQLRDLATQVRSRREHFAPHSFIPHDPVSPMTEFPSPLHPALRHFASGLGSDGDFAAGNVRTLAQEIGSTSESTAEPLDLTSDSDTDDRGNNAYEPKVSPKKATLKARKVLGIDIPTERRTPMHIADQFATHRNTSSEKVHSPARQPRKHSGRSPPIYRPRQTSGTVANPSELDATPSQNVAQGRPDDHPGYFPHQFIAELPTQRYSVLAPTIESHSLPLDRADETNGVDGPVDAETEDTTAPPHLSVTPSSASAQNTTVPSITVFPPRVVSSIPGLFVDVATQTDPEQATATTHVGVQTEEIRLDMQRFQNYLSEPTDQAQGERIPRVPSPSQMTFDTNQSVSIAEMIPSLESRAIRDTVERSYIVDPSQPAQLLPGNAGNRTSFWGTNSSTSTPFNFQKDTGIPSGKSSMLGNGAPRGPRPESVPSLADLVRATSALSARSAQGWEPDFQGSDAFSQPARPATGRSLSSVDRAYQLRGRASSVGSSVRTNSLQPPPFPVPTRSSSRMLTDMIAEASGESDWNDGPAAANSTSALSVANVRKLRSATTPSRAMSAASKRRSLARMKSLDSLLFDERDSRHDGAESIFSGHNPIERDNALSRAVSGEESRNAELVDAISSAMAGEWMWKYSQKASSKIDLGDSPVRQKRWIWISPEDRTIMWSSKQPSGLALQGKSSRKLLIKTILDVKDDNAVPKTSVAMSHFDRSIVVLTAQRQLKITATSKESHYRWLMALSYLVDNTQAPPELPRVPLVSVGKQTAQADQEYHPDPIIGRSISRAESNILARPRNVSAPMVSLTNDGEDCSMDPQAYTVASGLPPGVASSAYRHSDAPPNNGTGSRPGSSSTVTPRNDFDTVTSVRPLSKAGSQLLRRPMSALRNVESPTTARNTPVLTDSPPRPVTDWPSVDVADAIASSDTIRMDAFADGLASLATAFDNHDAFFQPSGNYEGSPDPWAIGRALSPGLDAPNRDDDDFDQAYDDRHADVAAHEVAHRHVVQQQQPAPHRRNPSAGSLSRRTSIVNQMMSSRPGTATSSRPVSRDGVPRGRSSVAGRFFGRGSRLYSD